MSSPVAAASRLVWVWRLLALIVLVAMVVLVTPRIISLGYPAQVTTPEVIGLVASINGRQ